MVATLYSCFDQFNPPLQAINNYSTWNNASNQNTFGTLSYFFNNTNKLMQKQQQLFGTWSLTKNDYSSASDDSLFEPNSVQPSVLTPAPSSYVPSTVTNNTILHMEPSTSTAYMPNTYGVFPLKKTRSQQHLKRHLPVTLNYRQNKQHNIDASNPGDNINNSCSYTKINNSLTSNTSVINNNNADNSKVNSSFTPNTSSAPIILSSSSSFTANTPVSSTLNHSSSLSLDNISSERSLLLENDKRHSKLANFQQIFYCNQQNYHSPNRQFLLNEPQNSSNIDFRYHYRNNDKATNDYRQYQHYSFNTSDIGVNTSFDDKTTFTEHSTTSSTSELSANSSSKITFSSDDSTEVQTYYPTNCRRFNINDDAQFLTKSLEHYADNYDDDDDDADDDSDSDNCHKLRNVDNKSEDSEGYDSAKKKDYDGNASYGNFSKQSNTNSNFNSSIFSIGVLKTLSDAINVAVSTVGNYQELNLSAEWFWLRRYLSTHWAMRWVRSSQVCSVEKLLLKPYKFMILLVIRSQTLEQVN
uniref:Fork-head domain-containing protein n=1 Tax=Syphacia muris TaxID=451379 RepID=A0A0N5AT61_9BILA